MCVAEWVFVKIGQLFSIDIKKITCNFKLRNANIFLRKFCQSGRKFERKFEGILGMLKVFVQTVLGGSISASPCMRKLLQSGTENFLTLLF